MDGNSSLLQRLQARKKATKIIKPFTNENSSSPPPLPQLPADDDLNTDILSSPIQSPEKEVGPKESGWADMDDDIIPDTPSPAVGPAKRRCKVQTTCRSQVSPVQPPSKRKKCVDHGKHGKGLNSTCKSLNMGREPDIRQRAFARLKLKREKKLSRVTRRQSDSDSDIDNHAKAESKQSAGRRVGKTSFALRLSESDSDLEIGLIPSFAKPSAGKLSFVEYYGDEDANHTLSGALPCNNSSDRKSSAVCSGASGPGAKMTSKPWLQSDDPTSIRTSATQALHSSSSSDIDEEEWEQYMKNMPKSKTKNNYKNCKNSVKSKKCKKHSTGVNGFHLHSPKSNPVKSNIIFDSSDSESDSLLSPSRSLKMYNGRNERLHAVHNGPSATVTKSDQWLDYATEASDEKFEKSAPAENHVTEIYEKKGIKLSSSTGSRTGKGVHFVDSDEGDDLNVREHRNMRHDHDHNENPTKSKSVSHTADDEGLLDDILFGKERNHKRYKPSKNNVKNPFATSVDQPHNNRSSRNGKSNVWSHGKTKPDNFRSAAANLSGTSCGSPVKPFAFYGVSQGKSRCINDKAKTLSRKLRSPGKPSATVSRASSEAAASCWALDQVDMCEVIDISNPALEPAGHHDHNRTDSVILVPSRTPSPASAQMKEDELMARRLQEEMDREFASTISTNERTPSSNDNLQQRNSAGPLSDCVHSDADLEALQRMERLTDYQWRCHRAIYLGEDLPPPPSGQENQSLNDLVDARVLEYMERHPSSFEQNPAQTPGRASSNLSAFSIPDASPLLLGPRSGPTQRVINRRRRGAAAGGGRTSHTRSVVHELWDEIGEEADVMLGLGLLTDDEWAMHAAIHGGAAPGVPQRGRRGGNRNSDPILAALLAEHNLHMQQMFVSPRGRQGRRRRRGAGHLTVDEVDGNDYEALWDLAERLGEVRKKGLTKAQIRALPTKVFKCTQVKESETVPSCNVCMTEYEEGDSLRMLPCFHDFHQNCIDTWIKENPSCPICRAEVKV